jgi:hypothetical protein
MATGGTELMQQLMGGDGAPRTSKEAEGLRARVAPEIHELLDQGARVRPLTLNGEHLGFVRGLHGSERRLIYNWYPDPEMRILQIAAHGTTLTIDEIETLSGTEIQNLIRQINAITEADFSLYPYISAFATTSVSELLWYGRGAAVATWARNRIEIPGATSTTPWVFNLLAPPEHARLWAGVAALRERSKRRLDDTFNAAMITRAMVGKGADKLYQSLKKTQKSLMADILDAWMDLVPADLADVNLKDGWGHALADDSREGVMRELTGMEGEDRHERVMGAFYKQQMDAAQAQEAKLNQTVSDVTEGVEDMVSYLTSVQVHDMHRDQAATQSARNEFIADAIGNTDAGALRRERRAEGQYEPPQL